MATTTEQSHSEQQAAAQLESIKGMVASLECDYKRLEELREERDDYEQTPETDTDPGTAATWAEEFTDDAEELAELEAAAGECEDAEDAEERIQEDPLSVEVRSGWATVGDALNAEQFCILLCTGGPACRLLGDLDEHNSPERVWMEHQDWGTPWTMHFTHGDDNDALLNYASQFFYGE